MNDSESRNRFLKNCYYSLDNPFLFMSANRTRSLEFSIGPTPYHCFPLRKKLNNTAVGIRHKFRKNELKKLCDVPGTEFGAFMKNN